MRMIDIIEHNRDKGVLTMHPTATDQAMYSSRDSMSPAPRSRHRAVSAACSAAGIAHAQERRLRTFPREGRTAIIASANRLP